MAEFGLYIHIPYCLSKCPYCDFNSYAISPEKSKKTVAFRETDYIKALCAELSYRSKIEPWRGRNCSSIFFGGGTPSLLSAQSLESIIAQARACFPWQGEIEITIEANPSSISERLTVKDLEDFHSAGINRVSIGAQSFSEPKLKALGRWHSTDSIEETVRFFRQAGFKNLNLDLIFGVQGESLLDWKGDLARAISLEPDHLSCYSLTVEPGTEFASQLRRGKNPAATSDQQAELYEHTRTSLRTSGFEQYEVSAFSRPDKQCQHNLGYWSWADYLGIGAGAHSFCKLTSIKSITLHGIQPSHSVTQRVSSSGILKCDGCNLDSEQIIGARWSNAPKPEQYIQRSLETGDSSQRSESIARAQGKLEYLLVSMRTVQGASISDYANYFGADLLEEHQKTLMNFFEQDLLEVANNRLRLTAKGLPFVDELLKQIY